MINSEKGDNSYIENGSAKQGEILKRINYTIPYEKYLSDILRNKHFAQEQNLAEEKNNNNQKKNNKSFHRKVERLN